jgi:Fe-S-cluster-containing dehydrogenase component
VIEKMYIIREKSIIISIDTEKCVTCVSKACVEACRKYARGLLVLDGGVPSAEHLSKAEMLRLGTECLACEYACAAKGREAVTIEVPIEGISEYLHKRGLA